MALLKEIVLARSVWKWEFPRETRIVALQALLKIDPPTAKNVLKSSGISMDELQLSQLKPASGDVDSAAEISTRIDRWRNVRIDQVDLRVMRYIRRSFESGRRRRYHKHEITIGLRR